MYHYIEKWKQALDQGKKIGTMFTDLTKVFDTLNHNLLLSKLYKSYMSKRFQRIYINKKFSEQCKVFLRLPQGSILDLLLFNIFIKDIFYFIQD